MSGLADETALDREWPAGLHELHCREDRCGPDGELCSCPCHRGEPVPPLPGPEVTRSSWSRTLYRLEVRDRAGEWHPALQYLDRERQLDAELDYAHAVRNWDQMPQDHKDTYGQDAREFHRVVKIHREVNETTTVLTPPADEHPDR